MSQADTRRRVSNRSVHSNGHVLPVPDVADTQCVSLVPECDSPASDNFLGISESLLVAPRIPKAANTPKLNVPGIGGTTSRLGITLRVREAHESRLAAPLALLVGVAFGLLASWFIGIF